SAKDNRSRVSAPWRSSMTLRNQGVWQMFSRLPAQSGFNDGSAISSDLNFRGIVADPAYPDHPSGRTCAGMASGGGGEGWANLRPGPVATRQQFVKFWFDVLDCLTRPCSLASGCFCPRPGSGGASCGSDSRIVRIVFAWVRSRVASLPTAYLDSSASATVVA